MKKTKILTVANRKGGAGKSTCVAHLSLEAVKNGLKVLLIDLDPQKTLEGWWEKRKEDNPQMATVDPKEIEFVIDNASKYDFDLCIIDTPGDASLNALNGIKVADLILIPTKPTAPDLSAIGRTIHFVEQNNKDFIFLVTQAIPNTNAGFQSAGILSNYGQVIPDTMKNRNSYAKAMQEGISATEIDVNAKQEMKAIWNVISNKLLRKPGENNDKEKIRFGS
jgi:chromosome partitioning protein